MVLKLRLIPHPTGHHDGGQEGPASTYVIPTSGLAVQMAAVPPLVGLALPTGVDGVPDAVRHEARDRTLPGTTGSAVAWLTPNWSVFRVSARGCPSRRRRVSRLGRTAQTPCWAVPGPGGYVRRLAVATPILGASPRKGRGRGGPRALRPAGSTPPRPGSLHSRWPVQCQPRACNARASRHWFLKGDKVFSVRLRETLSMATRRRSTSSSPRATSLRSRRLDRFRKPLRRLPFLRRLCRGGAVHCSNLGPPLLTFAGGGFFC